MLCGHSDDGFVSLCYVVELKNGCILRDVWTVWAVGCLCLFDLKEVVVDERVVIGVFAAYAS